MWLMPCSAWSSRIRPWPRSWVWPSSECPTYRHSPAARRSSELQLAVCSARECGLLSARRSPAYGRRRTVLAHHHEAGDLVAGGSSQAEMNLNLDLAVARHSGRHALVDLALALPVQGHGAMDRRRPRVGNGHRGPRPRPRAVDLDVLHQAGAYSPRGGRDMRRDV